MTIKILLFYIGCSLQTFVIMWHMSRLLRKCGIKREYLDRILGEGRTTKNALRWSVLVDCGLTESRVSEM